MEECLVVYGNIKHKQERIIKHTEREVGKPFMLAFTLNRQVSELISARAFMYRQASI